MPAFMYIWLYPLLASYGYVVISFRPNTSAIFFFQLLTPLTPKGKYHLISPYNITPESHVKVTRVKEMITN